MRRSEPFSALERVKATFASSVANALLQVPDVKSITFTGSFVEESGLAGISDIDVVVVVRSLTQDVFTACKVAVTRVSPAVLGLADYRLVVNDTFGPLKFDQPGVVVVHLMVYDIAGHREHVLQSPFTCLDWERSTFYAGSSLRAIYPALQLQPRQFFESRRGLADYLEDIVSGTISFRRHQFNGSTRSEILEHLPLDRRHQGEYAFHIVRNLVANYLKLVSKKNQQLPEAELLDFWRTHLPACGQFIDWFSALRTVKHARQSGFPANTLDKTRAFLTAFSKALAETWTQRAIRYLFVRHARTILTNGSFLGQRRDPSIYERPAPLDRPPRSVFTSPALRCRETAAALVPDCPAVVDVRLHEIDYGRAEGQNLTELLQNSPEMSDGWNHGEDPPFPGGENTAAVAARLDSFLGAQSSEPSLVVTHNVVLRCLIGAGLGLPLSTWHRIPVAHLEQFEVLRLDGVYYLNLSSGQITGISDALAGHLS
jgi:ribonuclease H / adenosylcobalamin/alpha-ribazole phosphatase